MNVTLYNGPSLPEVEKIILAARQAAEKDNSLEAATLYSKVLEQTTEHEKSGWRRVMYGEACAFFAHEELRRNNLGIAFDWFRKALRADPRANHIRIDFILKVLIPLDIIRNARAQAERAIKIEPDDPAAWEALGRVETQAGNVKKAISAYRKAVDLSQRSSLSLLYLVGLLTDTEQYKEAEAILDEIAQRNEEMRKGDVLHHRGVLKSRYGQHEEAIELYKQALECFPVERSLVHFHMSLSLHAIGKYKEGFESLAKRINNASQVALYVPMRRFNKPLFEMQKPPAIVHIHAEAGDGDNLCLIRYLPLLAEKGYTVRYEVRENLFKLSKDSLSNVEVVPEALDYPGTLGIQDFDYHLPIGELPYQFGTDIDTVPWNGPYLKADIRLIKKYERHSGKIGIAWSSGIRRGEGIWLERYGELKSLSFELIKPIVMREPENFVSLQGGPPADENRWCIANVLPENLNWADTAAIIENLDLVITPDTGLAHLAGGMGKETWLMMHDYAQGWHFMCARPGSLWNTRSPWYPSVRIFRQRTPGDWDSVVDAIVDELKIRRKKVA